MTRQGEGIQDVRGSSLRERRLEAFTNLNIYYNEEEYQDDLMKTYPQMATTITEYRDRNRTDIPTHTQRMQQRREQQRQVEKRRAQNSTNTTPLTARVLACEAKAMPEAKMLMGGEVIRERGTTIIKYCYANDEQVLLKLARDGFGQRVKMMSDHKGVYGGTWYTFNLGGILFRCENCGQIDSRDANHDHGNGRCTGNPHGNKARYTTQKREGRVETGLKEKTCTKIHIHSYRCCWTSRIPWKFWKQFDSTLQAEGVTILRAEDLHVTFTWTGKDSWSTVHRGERNTSSVYRAP
jgi:hypothetical protein